MIRSVTSELPASTWGSIPCLKPPFCPLFIHLSTFNMLTFDMLSSRQAFGEAWPKLFPHYHCISKVVFKYYLFSPLAAVLQYSEDTLLGNSICKRDKGSVLVEGWGQVHATCPFSLPHSRPSILGSLVRFWGTPFSLGTKESRHHKVVDNMQPYFIRRVRY